MPGGIRSALLAGVIAALCLAPAASAAAGERHLRVHKTNPRYFGDGTGNAVYLTGSHVWWNLTGPDWFATGRREPGSRFSYERYLDRLARHGHNFIRLWRIEHTRWGEYDGQVRTAFQPWPRTGPGTALDGLPRFDLSRLDPTYFERLRDRVAAARKRGMYVSVMLFEGWLLHSASAPWNWAGHPFHAGNNVNGIDGDLDGDGAGTEIVTLQNPEVLAVQEAYVRRVVETVNRYDNVLYEIANEAGRWSVQWQYHMIRLVKRLQRARKEPRPVGMTFAHPHSTNGKLYASPADWISPFGMRYMTNPPPGDGRKVVVSDTDHHCGICGDPTFAWRSLLRGLHPIYMDDLDLDRHDPAGDAIRRSLGQTRRFAERIDLAASRPRPRLASTRYALAAGKRQLLVYAPRGGRVRVDLRKRPGRYAVEWFRPATGRTVRPRPVRGGTVRVLRPPFPGEAVLFLRRLPAR